MMRLAWGKHVSETFRGRLFQLCANRNWQKEQASDLMGCMAWETGCTFSPSVVNGAGSHAVGLIQFMPSTADGLGTSTAALARMTAVEQLDYVEMFFKPYASRIHTLDDMYLAILMPKYIATNDDVVVFENGHIAYQQNRGFDANRDGTITKREICARVRAVYEEGMLDENGLDL